MKPVVFSLLAILILAACSTFGGDDPRWDTEVPDSAPVEASLGTWGPEESALRSSTRPIPSRSSTRPVETSSGRFTWRPAGCGAS
jgi:hypothetical protein